MTDFELDQLAEQLDRLEQRLKDEDKEKYRRLGSEIMKMLGV